VLLDRLGIDRLDGNPSWRTTVDRQLADFRHAVAAEALQAAEAGR
jgi:hypothetical protein